MDHPDSHLKEVFVWEIQRKVRSNSFVLLLTVIGTAASVAGLILTIVFRIKDKNNHEMKESNRHAKG